MKSDSKDPIVSVIVPVYNTEQYVEECIRSIINQTYVNLQIIIINDGSTDNSYGVCKELQKEDERITIINQKNLGVSLARNNGINVANGEYIMFVDSDDFIKETMIESLLKIRDAEDADLVICNGDYYPYNKKINPRCFSTEPWIMRGKDQIDIFQRKWVCKGIKAYRPYVLWGYPHMKLYKALIIKDNNIVFPKDALGEDGIFNMYVAEHCDCIVYTDCSYYYYRQTDNSLSRGYNENIVYKAEVDYKALKEFANIYRKDDAIFMAGIDIRIATWFKSFLWSYYFTDKYIEEKGYLNARSEVLKLMNREPYKNAYKNAKFKYMTKREKIFVFAMKKKMIDLIYIKKIGVPYIRSKYKEIKKLIKNDHQKSHSN